LRYGTVRPEYIDRLHPLQSRVRRHPVAQSLSNLTSSDMAGTSQPQAAEKPSLLHLAYLVAITIKGIDGLIETIAGLIVAIVGSEEIYILALRLTAPEIENNPASHTADLVRHAADKLASAPSDFVVIYMIAHGVIKLALAINLMIEKDWVFPVASVLLTGFILYMSHRLTIFWSPWLFAFLLFDMVTLALVLNEWRTHRARHA